MQVLLATCALGSLLALIALVKQSTESLVALIGKHRGRLVGFAGIAFGLQALLVVGYQLDRQATKDGITRAIGAAVVSASGTTQHAILENLRVIQDDINRERGTNFDGVRCLSVEERLDIAADQQIRGRSCLSILPTEEVTALAFPTVKFEYGRTRYTRDKDGFSIKTASPAVRLRGSDLRDVALMAQGDVGVDLAFGYFTLDRFTVSETEREGFAITTATIYLNRDWLIAQKSAVSLTIDYSIVGWSVARPAMFTYVNPAEFGQEGVGSYKADLHFEEPLIDRHLVLLEQQSGGALSVRQEPTDASVSVAVSSDLKHLSIVAPNGMSRAIAVFYRQSIRRPPVDVDMYSQQIAER